MPALVSSMMTRNAQTPSLDEEEKELKKKKKDNNSSEGLIWQLPAAVSIRSVTIASAFRTGWCGLRTQIDRNLLGCTRCAVRLTRRFRLIRVPPKLGAGAGVGTPSFRSPGQSHQLVIILVFPPTLLRQSLRRRRQRRCRHRRQRRFRPATLRQVHRRLGDGLGVRVHNILVVVVVGIVDQRFHTRRRRLVLYCQLVLAVLLLPLL